MRTFQKSHLPEAFTYDGKTYYRCNTERVYPEVSKVLVKVLSRNLRGKTDLHGKPYGPRVYEFSCEVGMEKTEDVRTIEMVRHYQQYGWARSNINNDNAMFFVRAGLDPMAVGTTSFTGDDVVYYDTDKLEPGCGGVRPIKVHADGDK